jgi:hypothetical protein
MQESSVQSSQGAHLTIHSQQVQPFSCRSGNLLWPLLNSATPSQHLSMPVSHWQSDRPPRVRRVTFTLIPAASTSAVPVQVSGFEDMGLLTHCVRLLCDFCSSGQCFAFDFLRIPPRGGHPCRSANCSPCRDSRGLAPPSHPVTTTMTRTAPVKALRAMPGAPKENTAEAGLFFA